MFSLNPLLNHISSSLWLIFDNLPSDISSLQNAIKNGLTKDQKKSLFKRNDQQQMQEMLKNAVNQADTALFDAILNLYSSENPRSYIQEPDSFPETTKSITEDIRIHLLAEFPKGKISDILSRVYNEIGSKLFNADWIKLLEDPNTCSLLMKMKEWGSFIEKHKRNPKLITCLLTHHLFDDLAKCDTSTFKLDDHPDALKTFRDFELVLKLNSSQLHLVREILERCNLLFDQYPALELTTDDTLRILRSIEKIDPELHNKLLDKITGKYLDLFLRKPSENNLWGAIDYLMEYKGNAKLAASILETITLESVPAIDLQRPKKLIDACISDTLPKFTLTALWNEFLFEMNVKSSNGITIFQGLLLTRANVCTSSVNQCQLIWSLVFGEIAKESIFGKIYERIYERMDKENNFLKIEDYLTVPSGKGSLNYYKHIHDVFTELMNNKEESALLLGCPNNCAKLLILSRILRNHALIKEVDDWLKNNMHLHWNRSTFSTVLEECAKIYPKLFKTTLFYNEGHLTKLRDMHIDFI